MNEFESDWICLSQSQNGCIQVAEFKMAAIFESEWMREDNKVSESKMAVSESKMAEFKI